MVGAAAKGGPAVTSIQGGYRAERKSIKIDASNVPASWKRVDGALCSMNSY